MARFIGSVLGAAHAATSQTQINPAYNNGRVARIIRDVLTADMAQNDVVSLGYVDWNTIFDEHSVINFTDAGTGVTMDVGVAGAVDCLIDGQDIATAAGSASLLKSVAIGDRHKPLWQLAGYASLQAAKDDTVADGGRAELIATILGGNPDAMTLAWTIYGSPQ